MQQPFNQDFYQFSQNEAVEIISKITNLPKNDFLNVLTSTILMKSSIVLTTEEINVSKQEKNQLLLEQLNIRNGIRYSMPPDN